MNKIITRAIFLVSFLIAFPLNATADVDEKSIFEEARHPISRLDLQLSNIQNIWRQHFVNSPGEEAKRKYPLITKAGVTIELDYFGGDRISVQGWISKLDGFLELSAGERKQLVSNTLELVKGYLYGAASLVDKKTGRHMGKILENRHIELCVTMLQVLNNDKNENIRLLLPSEIGFGQAGYRNGQFVFSETYFLMLQVHDGRAVSGDPNKFIIERE